MYVSSGGTIHKYIVVVTVWWQGLRIRAELCGTGHCRAAPCMIIMMTYKTFICTWSK